jgi:ATP-binding cassette subfamily B protein
VEGECVPEERKITMLWRLTKGQRPLYAASIAVMGIGILLLYLSPQIVRETIDGVIKPKTADGDIGPTLALAGLAVIAVTLLSGFFTYLKGRWSAFASESIARTLRERLYDHLQHLPVSYHDSAQTGDLVQRCTSDVETLRTFYSTQVVEIARAILLLATAFPILLWMDWRMALVAVGLMPVIVAFAVIFFGKVQHSFKEADEAEGKMTTVLQENLTGIRVVRAFARQEFEKAKFKAKNGDHRRLNYWLFVVMAVYWAISDFLVFAQMASVLVAGAWRVSHGTMSVGTLVAFLQYEAMVIWPVRQMGRILTDLGKAIVSLGRIEEILQQAPEESRAGLAPPPVELPKNIRGEIILRDVSFSHGPKPILHSLNLSIKPGETLAIVGPSGSGKSTLISLLLRFYDYTGSITLDGLELRDLPRKFVRSQFGVVMQEPFLYSKTLLQNITLGRHTAAPEEAIEAAGVAAMDGSIQAFEKKYDTLIGERGVTLSGGQRQRVAIARAILRQAPVLVFDDALSAVDTRTEAEILEALARRRGRHTTILIAHRLSTLSQADHVVVLEHGRIVQYGTHAELVAQDGLYRRLWLIQSALEEDLRADMAETDEDLTQAPLAS